MSDPEDRNEGNDPADAPPPGAASAGGSPSDSTPSDDAGSVSDPAGYENTPDTGESTGAVAPGRPRRRRSRRALWLTIQFGILGIIMLSIGTVGFVEYSAQPGFCDNCHNMVPYYQSWATSTHNNVPCIKCHYAPGIKAEAMGKLQAANQVVKYVTGTYGLRPWAEVEDAACLRSGCHVTRKLEGEVTFQGVRFDHTAHLGELRRGKQLRCTSCHSQIVQGQHLTVTESTCFLCHFKDRPPGDPIAGCTGCHPSPPRVVSPAGFVVEHGEYVRDLVSCTSCHNNITTGTGGADRSRCLICHNEPERLDKFNDTDMMHRVHIAEHNVECAQCHLEIQHRVVSNAESFDLDCRGCHQQTHDNQRKLYAGIGGMGTSPMPSSMYLANVSCTGCHELTGTIRGHEKVALAGEASCMSCHGTRYANILPGWKQEMDRKTARVGSIVRQARAAAAGSRIGSTVDSLLNAAAENLSLVENGGGVHNIAFADELLRQTVEFVRSAVRAGSLPYTVPTVDLGPSVTGNQCMQCHLGTERRTVAFNGRQFDHERHVLRAGLGCNTCHNSMDQHPGTRLTSFAQCQACHHRTTQPMACERCHAGATGAPIAPVVTPVGDFLHPTHVAANLACATCHLPANGMSAAGLDCESCHDSHHQLHSNCLSCHKPDSGVQAKHNVRDAHAAQCTSCHRTGIANLTTWTRQVCTVCHTDKVDHEAPQPCESCHVMPARRGATGGGGGGSMEDGRTDGGSPAPFHAPGSPVVRPRANSASGHVADQSGRTS